MVHNSRVALIGFGNLARVIAEGIAAKVAGPYEVVAAYDPYVGDEAHDFACKQNIKLVNDLDAILKCKPDYIIEAARSDVLATVALPCLAAGANLIVLSTGAFADEAFWDEVALTAGRHNRKVYVASGAIGGLDLAQSAKLVGDLKATMITEKPPRALEGAPALGGKMLPTDAQTLVFSGTAREAFAAFPQNLNVAVALSLATVGVSNLNVLVKSNPTLSGNKHTILLEGVFGKARLELELTPSPNNPKSAFLAAFSVLHVLRKLASPIQI